MMIRNAVLGESYIERSQTKKASCLYRAKKAPVIVLSDAGVPRSSRQYSFPSDLCSASPEQEAKDH